MSASVLLDTSFLISLVDANRPHHATAQQYYLYCLQTGSRMYLSAIVAAEFGIKQAITDLPLKNFNLLDFNIPHGKLAAHLWNAMGQRDEGDNRAVVRDDVKLIAQTSHENIHYILTEDTQTLQKYCERLRATGQIQTRTITLATGFDANAMTASNQMDWVGTALADKNP